MCYVNAVDLIFVLVCFVPSWMEMLGTLGLLWSLVGNVIPIIWQTSLLFFSLTFIRRVQYLVCHPVIVAWRIVNPRSRRSLSYNTNSSPWWGFIAPMPLRGGGVNNPSFWILDHLPISGWNGFIFAENTSLIFQSLCFCISPSSYFHKLEGGNQKPWASPLGDFMHTH